MEFRKRELKKGVGKRRGCSPRARWRGSSCVKGHQELKLALQSEDNRTDNAPEGTLRRFYFTFLNYINHSNSNPVAKS
jgi:hypothetical protein